MNITAIDIGIVAIMGLAIVRGTFVGMIREGFSVGAIGAVVLGAVYGAGPAGAWLDNASAGEIGGSAAKVLGGAVAGVGAGVVVGALGRYLRRGARIVGLGMLDRVGGGAIGAAEGALVAMLVLSGATRVFGPDHPAVFNSYTVAVVEEMKFALETGTAPQLPGLPSVASGPPDSGN
jgi:uncharacterized membrane protein required for colicin V production